MAMIHVSKRNVTPVMHICQFRDISLTLCINADNLAILDLALSQVRQPDYANAARW